MSSTNIRTIPRLLFTTITITTTGGDTTILIRFILHPTGGTTQPTPITGDTPMTPGAGHPGTTGITRPGTGPIIMEFTLAMIRIGTTMVRIGRIMVIITMGPTTVTDRLHQAKAGQPATARPVVTVTP